jgi:glyoxylase-like metal-dependent hydrolase (beta-lactamase superfamily II)
MTAPDQPGFVSSRRIGGAAVTIIRDGTFGAVPLVTWLQVPEEEARHAMPEANAAGEIAFDFNAAHIQIGGASILVDPGFGDLESNTYPTTWYVQDLKARRSPGVPAGLASIGVRPEQITHVILTHTDEDHFMGVAVRRDGQTVVRYPRARHLLMRAGWDEITERAKPDSEITLRLGEIERLGLLDLVPDNYEVVPGVTLLHTPGETPNHCIVRVRSGEEGFYYLGDLFHHFCEIEHPDWFLEEQDRAAMGASRARFFADVTPQRDTLVYTHGTFPAWGRLSSTPEGYRWHAM